MGATEALESVSSFNAKLNYVFDHAICGDGYLLSSKGDNLSCPLAEQNDFDSSKDDQKI